MKKLMMIAAAALIASASQAALINWGNASTSKLVGLDGTTAISSANATAWGLTLSLMYADGTVTSPSISTINAMSAGVLNTAKWTHEYGTDAQNPLLRALARGHAYLRVIDTGEVKTVQDISRKFGIEHHLIMRSVRVALLSPTIQRAILDGFEPPGLSHGKILALNTLDWSEQERALGFA